MPNPCSGVDFELLQPNLPVAASTTARSLWSVIFFRRNSSGPALKIDVQLTCEVVRRGGERPIRTLAQRRPHRMVLDDLIWHLVRSTDRSRSGVVIVMLPGHQRSIAPRARFDL